MRGKPHQGALCAIKVHGYGHFFRLSEARRQQGEGSFPNALQINNCACIFLQRLTMERLCLSL